MGAAAPLRRALHQLVPGPRPPHRRPAAPASRHRHRAPAGVRASGRPVRPARLLGPAAVPRPWPPHQLHVAAVRRPPAVDARRPDPRVRPRHLDPPAARPGPRRVPPRRPATPRHRHRGHHPVHRPPPPRRPLALVIQPHAGMVWWIAGDRAAEPLGQPIHHTAPASTAHQVAECPAAPPPCRSKQARSPQPGGSLQPGGSPSRTPQQSTRYRKIHDAATPTPAQPATRRTWPIHGARLPAVPTAVREPDPHNPGQPTATQPSANTAQPGASTTKPGASTTLRHRGHRRAAIDAARAAWRAESPAATRQRPAARADSGQPPRHQPLASPAPRQPPRHQPPGRPPPRQPSGRHRHHASRQAGNRHHQPPDRQAGRHPATAAPPAPTPAPRQPAGRRPGRQDGAHRGSRRVTSAVTTRGRRAGGRSSDCLPGRAAGPLLAAVLSRPGRGDGTEQGQRA